MDLSSRDLDALLYDVPLIPIDCSFEIVTEKKSQKTGFEEMLPYEMKKT